MGNVSSRLEDGVALVLRDQNRLSIACLSVTNSRGNVLLNIVPNVFPATRIIAKKDTSDESLVDYIQDPESSPTSPLPSFLLRLSNEEELIFNFTFVVRQGQSSQPGVPAPIDTLINGLTFAFASNSKDLENLVTREFHADPNLHKNSNVELVGDYSTGGSSSVRFDWSWKWKPPRMTEDRGGGWRNTCGFLEYDQRAHRLEPLATFSFWVQNTPKALLSPQIPSPSYDMSIPPRLRLPSTQSVQSGASDIEHYDYLGPPSPSEPAENGLGLVPAYTKDNAKIDVSCRRPGEDLSAVEDGPLFRATMKALEQKTGNMRMRMKKVLRKAEAAQVAQVECNNAVSAFMEALRESNADAVQPALEHYFEKIAKEILRYEQQNTIHLQKLIIDPVSRLYNIDIKQAEAKKKDFEDESRDYYAYVSRYLGQRQDSLKEKKRNESDSKYQHKRRNFELKRFDYSSFMQDLHGGRKEQEVLSHLTKYADTQAKSYLATAKKVEEMTPQLDALIHEVNEADKEFKFQRTEREEKRRTLEKNTKTYIEPDATTSIMTVPAGNPIPNGTSVPGSDLSRADSVSGNGLHYSSSTASQYGSSLSAPSTTGYPTTPNSRPTSGVQVISPDKFKGIRDLEEKDHSGPSMSDKVQQKKEGLLWALSRPDSHVDIKGLNKQAWHKFWIVLDQGKLSEYSNWKQKLDLHMDPIDLRMASVREARNADRRFCFEVITPQYKRVYQAPSEDDLHNWMNAINNALQSAVEGRGQPQNFTPSSSSDKTTHRDIGSVLTGKSSSLSAHHHNRNSPNHTPGSITNNVYRRTTVGARPTYVRTESGSFQSNPSKLLQIVRDTDQGNCWCADCGSGIKTEWVSINLGIVLCIECSGIHRSLGTHISKVRSLTLDTHSFTTDIVELLLQIGNRVSNMIWEAKLDPSLYLKPTPQATRDQRLKFITAKYVDRAYITPLSPTLSHYPTADETLLASIKKNDLQAVLYALALRANPNATDRSRNTHAVFLALAAADPASPSSSSNTPSPRSTATPSLTPSPSQAKITAFPVAELLVQNGAQIPTSMPAFPLSENARLYVEQKGARDTVGELPVIRSQGGGNSPMGADKEREREAGKLQKRVSQGGRLVVR